MVHLSDVTAELRSRVATRRLSDAHIHRAIRMMLRGVPPSPPLVIGAAKSAILAAFRAMLPLEVSFVLI